MPRIVVAVALVVGLFATSALAEGDKNRGDKGQGTVTQVQVAK